MKAIYHSFTKGTPIIFVESFDNFANGVYSNRVNSYCRVFKDSPLKFIVFERKGMREQFGYVSKAVVDATLALYTAKRKYPLDEILQINEAIKMVVSENAVGAFKLLKELYENKTKRECPFEVDEYDWAYAHQMDDPGDEVKKRAIKEAVTDVGDTRMGSAVKKPKPKNKPVAKKATTKKPAAKKSTTKKTPTKKKPAAKKASGDINAKARAELKASGYKAIPGWESLWSKSGKPPAEKKIVKGKIVAPSAQDKIAGATKAGQDQAAEQPQTGNQTKPGTRKVKAVPVGSKEHKTSLDNQRKSSPQQSKAPKRKTGIGVSGEHDSYSLALAVDYNGEKDKEVDQNIGKGVATSLPFTRDIDIPDDHFEKINKGNWLSPSSRYRIDYGVFNKAKVAVPKRNLQLLERLINTTPTSRTRSISHFTKSAGAGQIASQAGELMMSVITVLDDDQAKEFLDSVSKFITKARKPSILEPGWLEAAWGNRKITRKRFDKTYGEGNWKMVASGWDTKDEYEAMTGKDYKKNKGYSSDVYFTIQTPRGIELDEVSLKKDLGIFFLNSGPKFFTDVDKSLKGTDLDVTVFAQKQEDQLKKAWTPKMMKSVVAELKKNPDSKAAKEVLDSMKKARVTNIGDAKDMKSKEHKKVMYKGIKFLASVQNKAGKSQYPDAEKHVKWVDKAFESYRLKAIKELDTNKKLNEGMLKDIRERLPIKAVADNEEAIALGHYSIDRATLMEIFGTNNADDIMENLRVYESPQPPFLGYAVGKKGKPIPVAKIRLRPDAKGYSGRIKFDMEMHPSFAKKIQEATTKVYGVMA